MSKESVRIRAKGSANLRKPTGAIFRVKRRGSSFFVTSSQRSGKETGADGSGRSEKGATIVLPKPFCPQSMYTFPARVRNGRAIVAICGIDSATKEANRRLKSFASW